MPANKAYHDSFYRHGGGTSLAGHMGIAGRMPIFSSDLTIMGHGFCQEVMMRAPGLICRDNIFVQQIHIYIYPYIHPFFAGKMRPCFGINYDLLA